MSDRPSFEELYQRYGLDVYRFCVFQLRDAEAAQDVAADVFVAALRAYDASDHIEDHRLWLIRIARNTIINHHRRNQRWRRILASMSHTEVEPVQDIESIAEISADVRVLLDVMAVLRPRQRFLVALRISSDMTYEEIGKAAGMSAQAAAKVTRRAMEKVRAELERRLEG